MLVTGLLSLARQAILAEYFYGRACGNILGVNYPVSCCGNTRIGESSSPILILMEECIAKCCFGTPEE